MPADMGREDDIRALARGHADRFGSLDLLVLCAGTGTSGRIADYPMRRFDRQMTVNVRAPFALVQECLPALRQAAAARPATGADRGDRIDDRHRLRAWPGCLRRRQGRADLAVPVRQRRGILRGDHRDRDRARLRRHRDERLGARPDRSCRDDPARDIAELVLALAQLSARSVIPLIAMSRPGPSQWRA